MVELNEKQLMEIDGGRGQHEAGFSVDFGYKGFRIHVNYKLTIDNSRKRSVRGRGRNYTLGITSRNVRRHRHHW